MSTYSPKVSVWFTEHEHIDVEEPWGDNAVAHSHPGGEKPHRHTNAPWWGATGSRYRYLGAPPEPQP